MTVIRTHHNRENPYVMLNKSIVQSKTLSLKAKGLWALLMSYPNDWKFYVKVLIEECQEGRTAVYNTIDELIAARLMVKIKTFERKPDGKMCGGGVEYIIFEFPISEEQFEAYQNSKENIIKPSHNEYDRDSGFGNSGNGNSGNQQLLNNDSLASTEEQQQQEQPAAVVVSSDQDSYYLLIAQGFDVKTAGSLAKFPIEQIQRQIEHLQNAQGLIEIDNPLGWLRNAIQNDWRPAEAKIDPAVEAAELRRKQLQERTDAKLECEDLFDEYERQFTTKKYFILGDDVLTMRSGDKNFGIPYDNGTVKTLKRFVDIEFEEYS